MDLQADKPLVMDPNQLKNENFLITYRDTLLRELDSFSLKTRVIKSSKSREKGRKGNTLHLLLRYVMFMKFSRQFFSL